MRFHLKILVFIAILAGISSFAQAGQTYFLIRGEKGGIVQFPVTDAIVAKVGMVSFKAVLPGMDDKMHDVRGPLMRDLLKAAGVDGTTALGVALDKYEVEIPTRDFVDYDVIAAIEVDGKRLSVREKGPAWIVYPSVDNPSLKADPVYEARSIWQLKELTVK